MSRPPDPANPLASLRFDNRFTRMLPADPVTENSRRQVFNSCYSRVAPVRPVAPQLVAYSPETAALIDLVTPDAPTEYRLGYQNFFVITRYNRSSFYATSVYEFAQALKQARSGDDGFDMTKP